MYNKIKMNRIIIWHLDQKVKILRLEREDIEEGIKQRSCRIKIVVVFNFYF
ncbi:hypothetical protein MtrunA17_Chr1g0201691 [Medicago truncatula]|uniref:Uncharacterized protein n=1 Tax=Medicago truncatula TaxID=3880 RepID=A0A396JZV9_MEDTR|nr:hypothetical protein MtrunA17_Chr1g0201691 [Medicago truncatula]